MNLLKRMATRCVRLQCEENPDGLGGRTAAWSEGEGFDAVLLKRRASSAVEGQRAVEAPGYDVVVDAAVIQRFHEVFRRLSDGQVFRMTGDTRDCAAPEGCGVPIARAGCERWDVP